MEDSRAETLMYKINLCEERWKSLSKDTYMYIVHVHMCTPIKVKNGSYYIYLLLITWSTANHVPGKQSCDWTLSSIYILHTLVCNIYIMHTLRVQWEEWHATMSDDSVWSKRTTVTHPPTHSLVLLGTVVARTESSSVSLTGKSETPWLATLPNKHCLQLAS